MTYRFTLSHRFNSVCTRFAISVASSGYIPRFNIAPYEAISVIRTDKILEEIDWGLVLPNAPTWEKGRIINIDIQQLKVNSYEEGLLHQKCIIPADGFFKWRQRNGKRQPWHFHKLDGSIFGIAGLWSQWPVGNQDAYLTCAILTRHIHCDKYGDIAEIPAILRTENEDTWLKETTSISKVVDISFFDSLREMEAFPVTNKVNSRYFQDAEAIKPVYL